MQSIFAKFILLIAFMFSIAAQAVDWSDTELQYLHGNQFREPFNPDDVRKDILTLQHASGHSLGRNFFFIDALKSDGKDEHADELYAEGYSSWSLSKLGGRSLQAGLIKDVNLTLGLNYGYKSYSNYGVNPRVLLPGLTLDLNVPGFSYLNVDVLAYIDRGRFDGRDNGCHAETYQITPVWKLPFSIGSARFSFEGFTDFIGEHGDCDKQILAQPQLRWDVGHHFDKSNKLLLGLEYQYWHNKFGIDGLKESLPQALLIFKF